MDDGGTGPATMADLRRHADLSSFFLTRLGLEYTLHADRLHGAVPGSRHSLLVSGSSRDRSWPRASSSAEAGRCPMIEIVWFCLVAIMIAGYVVLDGFDLGAGIIHLFVARNEQERQRVLRSIGPVWDGNEVWLMAGGGTLYFAFPVLYAAAFSGFYLALMMVLWMLILRGIAIELRSHIESPLWRPFWDLVFGGSSAVLALLYGAALGNVVRGVPLDANGFFFIPLWTSLQPFSDVGIVDWYTLLIGAAAFLTL